MYSLMPRDVADDDECEPKVGKRQRVGDGTVDKYPGLSEQARYLQKNHAVILGLKEILKLLSKFLN